MSETTTAAVDATVEDDDEVVPNFQFTPKAGSRNGIDERWAEVRYGVNPLDPKLPAHVVEIRVVDMGDQFDLAEIAENSVQNSVWLSLAIVAMSVISFDGVPIPRGRDLSKADLRSVLTKLGAQGVIAVREASNRLSSENNIKAAAGN